MDLVSPCHINDDLLLVSGHLWVSSVNDLLPAGSLDVLGVVNSGCDARVVDKVWHLRDSSVAVKGVSPDNLAPEPDVPVVVSVVAEPDCIGQFPSLCGFGMVVVVDNSVDLLVQPAPVDLVTMDVVAGSFQDGSQYKGWMYLVSPCYVKDDLLLMGVDCWESSVDDLPPAGSRVVPWVVSVGFDASVVDNNWGLMSWLGVVVVKPVHCGDLAHEPDVLVVVSVVAEPDCIGQLLSCWGFGMLVVVDNSVDLLVKSPGVNLVTVDVVAGVFKDSGQDK